MRGWEKKWLQAKEKKRNREGKRGKGEKGKGKEGKRKIDKGKGKGGKGKEKEGKKWFLAHTGKYAKPFWGKKSYFSPGGKKIIFIP